MQKWDVIIVGGGHAGCEAAYASARLGCRTAMVTLRKDRIGFMSCNPAIGGLAKGQLVKEIDALGGVMGVNTDQAAIQYRKLNRSKGPAVRSPRAQCDKNLYALRMQEFLSKVPRLDIVEDEVLGVETNAGRVSGLSLKNLGRVSTQCVVITSGTFLKAVMHFGEHKEEGGRHGDRASFGLSTQLQDLGFKLRRLKTGTPPRLHRKTIDFNKLEPQPGDAHPEPFSYFHQGKFPILNQINCYITHTNQQTHEIIEKNLTRFPIFFWSD